MLTEVLGSELTMSAEGETTLPYIPMPYRVRHVPLYFILSLASSIDYIDSHPITQRPIHHTPTDIPTFTSQDYIHILLTVGS